MSRHSHAWRKFAQSGHSSSRPPTTSRARSPKTSTAIPPAKGDVKEWASQMQGRR